MANVRRTPKRRRDECPVCERLTAYTTFQMTFVDPYYTKTFVRHNDPKTGETCTVEPIRVQIRKR